MSLTLDDLRAWEPACGELHNIAMIYKKALADSRAGMNIYARLGMGNFGNDPCYQRCAESIELMRQPVMDNRQHAGIADQHFIDATRCRITGKSGVHIGVEQDTLGRKVFCKRTDDPGRLRINPMGLAVVAGGIIKFKTNLAVEAAECGVQRCSNESIFILDTHETWPKTQGEERTAKGGNDLGQIVPRRETFRAIFDMARLPIPLMLPGSTQSADDTIQVPIAFVRQGRASTIVNHCGLLSCGAVLFYQDCARTCCTQQVYSKECTAEPAPNNGHLLRLHHRGIAARRA